MGKECVELSLQTKSGPTCPKHVWNSELGKTKLVLSYLRACSTVPKTHSLVSLALALASPTELAEVFVPVPSGFGATVKALKLANPMKFVPRPPTGSSRPGAGLGARCPSRLKGSKRLSFAWRKEGRKEG